MTSRLSPIDMLDMPRDERAVLLSLTRRSGQDLAELAQSAKREAGELEAILTRLIEQGKLVEQLDGGQRKFSPRFGRTRRRIKNMPGSILAVFEEKPEDFLAQVELTAGLSDKERQTLLGTSVASHVDLNEVVAWEGDQVKRVVLLRIGLLKRSRLQRGQQTETPGYVRRFEWVGLGEMLGGYSHPDTLSAVTEGDLLAWSVEEFLGFVDQSPKLGLALSRMMSERLYEIEHQRARGRGLVCQ